MKKKATTSAAATPSGLFEDLGRLTGSSGKIDPEEVDARLLWKVVCILAVRSASIQIGVTRDGSAWAVQYWDGQFPVKHYHSSTYELNRSLAALIRADGKKDLSPEWSEIVGTYGW